MDQHAISIAAQPWHDPMLIFGLVIIALIVILANLGQRS